MLTEKTLGRTIKLVFIISIILISTKSCKSDKDRQEDNNIGFQNKQDFQDSLLQLKKTYYQFPSGNEMFNFIKRDESLDFIAGIVNPVENYSQYIDTKSKTLNLGVYLTDLTYLTLYKEIGKASDYLETIHKLYSDLRIDVPFSEHFVRRIKNNLNNEDSLIYLSEKYSDSFYHYMLSNNKDHILATVMAGSYIEGLYIALNLVDGYQKKSSVIQKIADQKYTFENLYFSLNENKDDLNVNHAMNYLQQILSILNKIETIDEPVKTSRNKDNKLVINGGKRLEITEKQFKELKHLVNQLREEIISNSN